MNLFQQSWPIAALILLPQSGVFLLSVCLKKKENFWNNITNLKARQIIKQKLKTYMETKRRINGNCTDKRKHRDLKTWNWWDREVQERERYGNVGEVNQVKQQGHNRAAWPGKHWGQGRANKVDWKQLCRNMRKVRPSKWTENQQTPKMESHNPTKTNNSSGHDATIGVVKGRNTWNNLLF